jgi:hypothetical protein
VAVEIMHAIRIDMFPRREDEYKFGVKRKWNVEEKKIGEHVIDNLSR